MPELPEVETTVRGISPYLDNVVIHNLIVRNKSLRWPVPVEELSTLLGQTVISVERRAKYILIKTHAGTLLLHLGMSGSLRVLERSVTAEKHDHIDIEISGGKVLRYNDPRRFGCCLYIAPDADINQHKLLASLGPEPLSHDFTGDYLFQKSRNRTVKLKNFIMDGKIVVGVGNIYASESLFMAGIRPAIAAQKVSKSRYQRLAEEIKRVLSKAIDAGGTTLNDFSQADGKPGYFKQELQVYGRDAQPCLVCETQIKSVVIGQRNTFYCQSCQTF